MRISKQGPDNRKMLGAHTVKFMCVRHLAEFFGTGEHVLRAKIEELKITTARYSGEEGV